MFTFIASQMLACSVSHSKEGLSRIKSMKLCESDREVTSEKKHLEIVLD